MNHKYPVVRQREDLRDHQYVPRLFATAASLPPMVDLRAKMPPVYDQGQLGSCTSNAWGALREYLAAQKNADFMPSRLFLYYYERVIDGTVKTDAGANMRDGGAVLLKNGVCPETEWPYNITKYASKPPAQCGADALRYVIKEYHAVSSAVLMKTALAEGIPVVIGMDVYASFESAAVAKTGIVPVPKKGESLLGGHAVMVVGYDDTKSWWTVRNSWGAGWGDKGYFYLPYAYGSHAYDFWTATA